MESSNSFSEFKDNHFNLPKPLIRLSDLTYNLWWTWNMEAVRLYRLLDPDLWESAEHNPVRFLRLVSTERLAAAARDRNYLENLDMVIRKFDHYVSQDQTWYVRNHPDLVNHPIAYFSTEFGLHEALPFYAGGLGILSGDFLKETSDLGFPLVAIGFLYTEGYFKQRITEDGWQEALYTSLSFSDMPCHPVLDDDGQLVLVEVDLPGRAVKLRIWKVLVGRVPLYLLDSNVEGNSTADRSLTSRLYTSDLELRISQEIILGIGGVRAIRLMGYNPAVWHLNEGHSAFMSIERLQELVSSGKAVDSAIEEIRSCTAFTTHTPVPAGNDEFPLWMIDKYFSEVWPGLGMDREHFIDLARQEHPWGEVFSMTLLAMKMSGRLNGVSELHGQVARKMWSFLWPEKQVEEIPILHVTNGIHTGSWLSRRMKNLFDEYFDADWEEHLDDPDVWRSVEQIPNRDLWAVRRHEKRKLVAYMRERARKPWRREQVHPVQVVAGGVLLDPYALTIGFARRFATYKRANLVLRDPERLINIVNQPGRPVQIIFAGKAHPADEPGKRLIQEVYRSVKNAKYGGRLVFLEDYDINLARYLVQGVDVWLNTPRRPKEASGTSGQKAALNGVLNFSILDGWWREGFNHRNGWAIGEEITWDDEDAQDEAEALSLYETLENEIIPLYYDRLGDDIPHEWLGWVKESIATLAPKFSMRRMVKEYGKDIYLPSIFDRIHEIP